MRDPLIVSAIVLLAAFAGTMFADAIAVSMQGDWLRGGLWMTASSLILRGAYQANVQR